MRLARLHRSLPLRSALALLLVAVQLLLGAHVFTHVQEARAQAQAYNSVPGDGGREDGKSQVLHERCALCLAALDLEAVLPASAPLAVLPAWTPQAPVLPALALRPFEAPCPPGRGPPSVV